MLTRLSLYNSPERVTSSLEEIPGPFFLSLSPSLFFSSPLLLEGWGGGLIVEHLSSSQLQRQRQLGDLWQHLHDAKPSNMLLMAQRAPLGSGESLKGSYPCLGATLMASGANISHPGIAAPASRRDKTLAKVWMESSHLSHRREKKNDNNFTATPHESHQSLRSPASTTSLLY